MNLRQLEAFHAIMTSGSATAAAERLQLSQSAVSRTLAMLEDDLGIRLFRRQKGRLVPTPEAEALREDAQRLLESAQCLRRHSEQLRQGGFKRRLLKVAIQDVLARTLLPNLAARFMADSPDVVVEALSESYPGAERAILSRDADVGLVRLPVDMPGLELLTVFDSDIVCVLPIGHVLASASVITPEMLEDHDLVLLGRQSKNRQELDFTFRRARVQMRVAVETNSVGVACGFVASGLGVALVNSLVANCCRDLSVVIRPFAPTITLQHGLAILQNSPAASLCRAFSAMMTEAILQQSVDGNTRVASAPRSAPDSGA